MYSEKATKFCEIFPLLLTILHTVKSKGKISQNFVAFSEYMNFKKKFFIPISLFDLFQYWFKKMNTTSFEDVRRQANTRLKTIKKRLGSINLKYCLHITCMIHDNQSCLGFGKELSWRCDSYLPTVFFTYHNLCGQC